MGNRFSWNKGKKAIMDSLNDTTDSISRKKFDSDISKHQISTKRHQYVLNQQHEHVTTSQELFPDKLKSNKYCNKEKKVMICSSTKKVNDEKWKSNSETNTQEIFMQSKLLNKMKCKDTRNQRKNTRNVTKRNQPITRIRSSNINESRQHTRNNNSNNNNNSDYRGTHPISSQGREIIQACFGNHHNEIGYRICMRVFEKRPDYRRFVYTLGKEKWLNASAELRDYLNNVVSKVHDITAIEEISRQYGEQHVPLKKYGFKPDFWVSIADALAVECVILDMASHQPTETVMAWSQLTSLMFTSIRDGYYAALRFQRQTLKNCKRIEWQLSIDSIRSSERSAATIVEKIC